MNPPLDSDDEDQFGLLINEEVALLSAYSSESDLLALSIAVLLDVGLSTLEDNATLLLVGLEGNSSQQEVPPSMLVI